MVKAMIIGSIGLWLLAFASCSPTAEGDGAPQNDRVDDENANEVCKPFDPTVACEMESLAFLIQFLNSTTLETWPGAIDPKIARNGVDVTALDRERTLDTARVLQKFYGPPGCYSVTYKMQRDTTTIRFGVPYDSLGCPIAQHIQLFVSINQNGSSYLERFDSTAVTNLF